MKRWSTGVGHVQITSPITGYWICNLWEPLYVFIFTLHETIKGALYFKLYAIETEIIKMMLNKNAQWCRRAVCSPHPWEFLAKIQLWYFVGQVFALLSDIITACYCTCTRMWIIWHQDRVMWWESLWAVIGGDTQSWMQMQHLKCFALTEPPQLPEIMVLRNPGHITSKVIWVCSKIWTL